MGGAVATLPACSRGAPEDRRAPKPGSWIPVSPRKVRVGLVGYGYSRFGAEFGFQDHPNVEVVAVSDLVPERCAELAKAARCGKTYPSLEKLVEDPRIEAVWCATDGPSHARHSMLVLEHGKHVACAVPATLTSIEEGEKLLAAVKRTGLKYMMFETSCYYEDLYAMRQLHLAGLLGKILYAEGEYYHYKKDPLPSFQNWRTGLPPQLYATHANAYCLGVNGGTFTDVSCMGVVSHLDWLQPKSNSYGNTMGTQVAVYRTSEGGIARMAISWDTPGHQGVTGRVRAEKGSVFGTYDGLSQSMPDLRRPPLPPGVPPGGHNGSHGPLMHEFIMSILLDRQPAIDIYAALNLSVPGIVAHRSALKDGENLKVPQYKA